MAALEGIRSLLSSLPSRVAWFYLDVEGIFWLPSRIFIQRVVMTSPGNEVIMVLWHLGKTLWCFWHQCHRVCPNIRATPTDIPNVMTSLPSEVSMSGVVLLWHFQSNWKCTKIAIWGQNFPLPGIWLLVEKDPMKLGNPLPPSRALGFLLLSSNTLPRNHLHISRNFVIQNW